MRALFVFLDGVGLGEHSKTNPFVYTKTPGLSSMLGGLSFTKDNAGFCGERASLLALDAALGVPGLPQSATGQAAIFTGENAPHLLGRHLNGFPNRRLRRLLADKGIFKTLKNQGHKVAFANAYRPVFFDKLRLGLPGNHYSCSTLVTYYGNVQFYNIADIGGGRALYMDITNDLLRKMGYDPAPLTPAAGARQLHKISARFDFCLFEYFLTDLAGHMGEREESARIVSVLDSFLSTLAALLNPAEEFLIVSSDHGNLEDLTTREHTLNKVPALMVGELKLRQALQAQMFDLTDILPALTRILEWRGAVC